MGADVDKKVTLCADYAHLKKGTVLDLLFTVADELDDFYVVQSSDTVYPMSIPVRYFVERSHKEGN